MRAPALLVLFGLLASGCAREVRILFVNDSTTRANLFVDDIENPSGANEVRPGADRTFLQRFEDEESAPSYLVVAAEDGLRVDELSCGTPDFRDTRSYYFRVDYRIPDGAAEASLDCIGGTGREVLAEGWTGDGEDTGAAAR